MKFFWDAERGVYVDERGRVVSPAALRKIQAESEHSHIIELIALAVAFALWRQRNAPLGGAEPMTPEEIFAFVDPAIVDKVKARVRTLGPVSSREYQVRMAEQITLSHNVNAVLAAGGLAAMTLGLWNYAASRARSERAFSTRLALEADRGLVSEAQLINRTSMYAEATYSTFSGATDRRERAAGTIQARRILDPGALHCGPDPDEGTPGCPELAEDEKGKPLPWQPIEEVVHIGGATCRSRCRCWIEYRREPAVAAAAAVALPGEQTEQAA